MWKVGTTSAAFKVNTYKPFGIPIVSASTLKEKARFAGEMQDSSTGLYYIFARYMDPELGRWLSLDPELGKLSMPQSMNRYVYCVNNPLRFVDPTGMKTFVPRHQESDMDFDEFMNMVGFIPVVDVISDLYFLGKAIYYEDWESAAFYAGCAAVPFIGSSWLKSGTKAAGKTFGIKWLDDLATVGKRSGKRVDDVPTGPGLRSADELFPESGFRKRLMGHTGVNPGRSMEAHHVFPREFAERFERLGIDINDPRYGAWVDASAHRHWSHEYNRAWETFLGGNPTRQQVIDFGKRIGEMPRYGFQVFF